MHRLSFRRIHSDESVTLVFCIPLRMSGGTRGAVRRARCRGANNSAEEEIPPPPTMAQVLQDIETNRLRNEHLLERVSQNTKRRHDDCVTLGDFIRATPPVFTHSKEPLNADDWLRTIERKFNALHVPEGDHVNFGLPVGRCCWCLVGRFSGYARATTCGYLA